MMTWRLFMVVLTLLSVSQAVPINEQKDQAPTKCSTYCSQPINNHYSPGTTYQYDYSLVTSTKMAGASKESADVKIQARAEIEVLGQCDFGLRLVDVSLRHSDAKQGMVTSKSQKEFSRTLQEHTVRFSFNDGAIQHLCPSPEDPTWAVNIKRGLLSAFQNSMSDWNQNENKTETDIAGHCKTCYVVYSPGYYTSILKKGKDMMTCTQRQQYRGFHKVVPYHIDSDIHSLPILKSSSECQLSVATKGLLQTADCTETHVFRPFSNGASGASTQVKQTLTFYGERRGVRIQQSPITKRTTLAYDFQDTESMNQDGAMTQALSTLTSLCQSTVTDIRPDTPETFSALIQALKPLNSQTMAKVYQRLRSGSLCPSNKRVIKFFMDALPHLQSSAGLEMMTSLILNDDVDKLEARTWVMSLAFLQSPTSAMLKSVTTLITNEKTRQMAMLPVSSMVNNYCQHLKSIGESCQDDPDVISIVSAMETGIDTYCDTRRDKLVKSLLTLRALGNAGHVTRSLGVITRCVRSRYSSNEVKITALQAFRRMPCTVDDRDLWQTIQDRNQDSELRINAYLSIMRCPQDAVLNKMATILAKEDNTSHVGSFIYSHLTNLMETSDPHKQNIARSIQRLTLEDKFNLDPMEYSRNIEISTLLNKINAGFTSDSNLVWSDQDQLPKSLSTNLTVELFGSSVNVFDFGGRISGLREVARRMWFGSNGGAIDRDLEMSIYGRMFGNEMFFSRYKTSPTWQTPKMPANVMELLISLSRNHDYHFTHSMQILDTSIAIPTAGGLPLHLHLNGTTTLDLHVTGKVDLRKVAAKPRSLDVQGEISPSAAIGITGTMEVHAFDVHSGLRMRNTMHTSTSLKGSVLLERGQQLHVEFDTPRDKMEIFEASSNFFLIHNDVETPQPMITGNRKDFSGCTSGRVAKVVGMEICGQLSFPNASMEMDSPYFPMTGPTNVKLTLNKKDTHTSYKLFVKRVENKEKSLAQVSFSTPGSKVSRTLLMDLTLNYPSKEIEVTLATPWKKAAMRGSMIDAQDTKSLVGKLVIDETQSYSLTSEVKMDEGKSQTTLTPMIVLRRPKMDDVQLTGVIHLATPFRSASAELSLKGLQKLPHVFKGEFHNTKTKLGGMVSYSKDSKKFYTFQASNDVVINGNRAMTINSILEGKTPDKQLMSFKGNFNHRSGKSLKMDVTAEIYKWMKKSTFSASVVKTPKKNAMRYISDIKLKSSKVSGRLMGTTTVKGSNLIASKMSLDYVIPRVTRNKIILNTKVNDRSTKSYNKYNFRSNLDVKKNPEYNMGLNVALDYKRRLAAANVELKYGPNPKDKSKRVTFNGVIKKKIKNIKNAQITYKMQAEAPRQDINWVVTGKHQHTPRMLNSNLQVTYAKGQKVTANVNVRDQSSKLKKMGGKMTLGWPGREYVMTSQLQQKNAKQYQHILSIKDNKGMKNDFSTLMTLNKAKTHSFSTTVNLDGMKPVVISASATLDPKNFLISGQAKQAKDVYGISANGKYAPKAPRGKIDIAVFSPEKMMGVLMEAGAESGKYQGKVETSWNMNGNNKKKAEKASAEGSYFYKSGRESSALNAMLQMSTPIQGMKDVGALLKLGTDLTKYDMSAKLTMGAKSRAVSTLATLKKPFSLYNIQGSMMTRTPIKGLRVVQLEINHKINPSLATFINGVLEDQRAEFSVSGEKTGDGFRRNLKGQASLKSNIRNAESIMLIFSHADDPNSFKSSSSLEHNKDKYTYDMDMKHYRSGWRIENSGSLAVSAPALKLSNDWNHKSSDSEIKSTLMSKWGKNQRLSVSLIGNHRAGSTRTIDSTLTIRSPWDGIQDATMMISHKHGNGFINSKSDWMEGKRQKAAAEVKYAHAGSKVKVDAMLSSPYNEDIKGMVSANYERYPVTSSAEIQWAPRSKATLSGSAVMSAWDNLDVDVKFTSPFERFENILLKTTSKVEKRENIVSVNIDTGIRRSIDLEGRFRNDRSKLMRFKMTTPYRQMSFIDTGINFNGEITDFDARADFELRPHVGKINGRAVMTYTDALNGNIHLESPFAILPTLDLSVAGKANRRDRMSTIDLKYGPDQSYTLDTSYSLQQMPITFETRIASSNRDLNGLSLSFQHDHSSSDIKSRAAVTYQPKKEIEVDVSGKWASDIEGAVMVKTPFTNAESSRVIFRHRNKGKAFDTRGEYAIAGHSAVVDASVKTGSLATGTITLKSTIPGAENVEVTFKKRGAFRAMKGSGMIKINDQKISGNFANRMSRDSIKSDVRLDTPYTEQMSASVDLKGNVQSFNVKAKSSYGRKYSMESITTFDMNGNDVNGNAMIKYKMGRKKENVQAMVTKSGPMENLQIGLTGIRNRQKIIFNGSLKKNRRTDLVMELKTPWRGYTDLSWTLNHAGNLNKFTTSSSMKYVDGKTIDGTIDFSFGNGRKIILFSEINSGIEGLESTTLNVNNNFDERTMDIDGKVEFKTTARRFGQGQITYKKQGTLDSFVVDTVISQNGKDKFSLQASNTNSYNNMKSELDLTTPYTEDLHFIFENAGDRRNVVITTAFKYGNRNLINGKMSMQRNQKTTKVGGEMTYLIEGMGSKDVSFDVFTEGFMNDVSVIANGKIDKDVYTVNAKLKNMNELSGSIAIKTPIYGYEDLGMSLKHSGGLERFNSEAKIKVSDSEKYEGAIEFYRYGYRRIETMMEVKTPIPGYEFTKFEYRHESDADSYSCFSTVEYGAGQKVVYDMSAKLAPRSEFKVNLKTPFRNYKDLLALVSYGATDSNYDVSSNFNVGHGRTFTLTGSFQTGREPTGYLVMTTPFKGFTDLSANFAHKGNSQKFDTTGKIVYTDGKAIETKVKVSQYWPFRLEASAEISTPFSGYETTKIDVQHNDNRRQMTTSMTAEYGRRRQKIDGTMVLKYQPSYDISVDLSTPYAKLRKIKGTGSLKTTGPPYLASYDVTVNDYDTYSASGKWNFASWKIIDGSIRMSDPRVGVNEAKYEHAISDRALTGTALVRYTGDNVISVDLKSSVSPAIEGTLTVNTPFDGYETMKANLMHQYENGGTIETMSKLEMGNGRVYQMDYSINYASEPRTVLAIINTPLPSFPGAELKMSHEGTWDNFKTTFYTYTPATDNIDASARLRFDSLFHMDAEMTLKSALSHADDIEVKLTHRDASGEKTANAMAQWTSGKAITYGVLFRNKNSWYEDNYHTEVSMTSPFAVARSASMVLDQAIKQKAYDEKFIIEYNGEQLVDMDTMVDLENDHSLEVVVRQPWPMQVIGKVTNQPGDRRGHLYVNWDRDETESNVDIHFTHQHQNSVQGFRLDIVHPTRSVGVSHQWSYQGIAHAYEGKLSWDQGDDNQLSYKLEVKDASQRRRQIYEGDMTVGLPGRSLGLGGSYSGYGQSQQLDAAFSWDAARDTSKKMGVKVAVTGSSPRKGELVVSLPSFDKELKIDGEMTLDNGRIVLDAKTDFSYSQDTRKTLTLTSKIQDITDYYNIYNYSVALGVTHPHTRTDVLVTSHLGESNEKMVWNANSRYLAARRQVKNMALFTEISKLKHQMQFQVFTPSHHLLFNSEQVSETPYKLQVRSSIDGDNLVTSELTVDLDKKALVLDTHFNDNKRLSMSAMYPNSTALRIEAIRRVGGVKEKELVIGLRLNTSRLLHTALTWRPGAVGELRNFLLTTAEVKGEKVIKAWREMGNEVAEEMAAKYTAITNAATEEMVSGLQKLQEEFDGVHTMLQDMMTSMTNSYYTNPKLWQTLSLGTSGERLYSTIRERMTAMAERFQRAYTGWFSSAFETVEEWRQYPARSEYMSRLDSMEGAMRENLRATIERVRRIDLNMDEMFEMIQRRKENAVDQFLNNDYIRQINNRISQVRTMDLSPYLYPPNITLPAAYEERLSDINRMLMSRMEDVRKSVPGMDYVHEGMNEVYQQLRWAYKYWDVEKNVPLHVGNGMNLVKDIALDEMKEHVLPLQSMTQNPVTVWQPERGIVQLCIPLPLPVYRLDQVPDWSPYVREVTKFLDQVTPDADTFVMLYENASEYLTPAEADTADTPDTETIKMTVVDRRRPAPPRRIQPRVDYENARRYRPRARNNPRRRYRPRRGGRDYRSQ